MIISVSPPPNSVYFTERRVAFEFSEHVDKSSFEQSVFVSPYAGFLEFEWSGTEVEILFGEALRENTTYVVTVGTDVVDIRNKNRMAESFSLAFSTGGAIDRGGIQGMVYTARQIEPASGIMMFAYRLNDLDPDTLDPAKVRPDYITQTGKTGSFSLDHLRFGDYRLFAVRDEYKNLLYDPETDEIGCLPADVRISEQDTLRTGLVIRLAREDTTGPRLVKVNGIHNRLVLAEFSEDLDTSTIRPEAFSITDTSGAGAIPIVAASVAMPGVRSVFLVTSVPLGDELRRLTVTGIRDSAGLSIHPLARFLDFSPSASVDTLPPGLRWSPRDSVKGMPLIPEILLTFNEPVKPVDWRQAVDLQDSLGRSVPVVGGWRGRVALFLRPIGELRGLSWYRFGIRQGMFEDFEGNRLKDTTVVVRFQTMDADRFSSIEGRIADANREDTAGVIVLRAFDLNDRRSRPTKIVVSKEGSFEFPRLPEGKYLLDAFRDRMANGEYNVGRPFPFVPSERFVVYRDTLRLRARWPLEGVKVDLR